MLNELPESAALVESGSLNLSTLSTVQTFIKREEKAGKTYSKKERQKLLQSMENKSTLEVEKILVQLAPESAQPSEKQRIVAPNRIELKLILTEAQIEKLEKLKDLLAHQIPDGALVDVLEKALDLALEKLDPAQKEARAQARREKTLTPAPELNPQPPPAMS